MEDGARDAFPASNQQWRCITGSVKAFNTYSEQCQSEVFKAAQVMASLLFGETAVPPP